MMRETRRRSPRALLLFAAVLGLAGAAGARPPHGPPPVGGLIERNAERLGLSGDSRAAVQAVVAASGARHAELIAQLDAARDAMRALLSQPVPDAAAVMAQADAIGAIETALHKNRLQAIMDIRALLTPEQRTELLKLHDEERGRREHEGKECGPHGDGPPGPPR